MQTRRIASIMTAAALGGAALVAAPNGSAQAAGSCTLTGPTRIVVDRPFREVTAQLAADCPDGAYASWYAIHPSRGAWDIAIFDQKRTTTIDVYSWGATLGTSYWRPSGAHTSSYDELTQNRLPVTVKAAGRGSLTTARKGRTVSLAGQAAYYRPGEDRYLPRRNTLVTFQTRSCTTCAWKKVTTVKTNAKGQATATVRAPRAAYYRIVVPGNSTIWDATSSPRRR